MNYSKIISWVLGIMALIGFLLLIGAVGASDRAVEMGVYEPLTAHIKGAVIGLMLMIPEVIYLNVVERSDET